MDPITAAIAAGAAAGLSGTAAQVVKDAYQTLKAALVARYPTVDVTALEARPSSRAKQESRGEDLAEVGADRDAELRALARALADAVEREIPQAAISAGVDLARVRAETLTIHEARGSDIGVRGQDWDVSGDLRIGAAQGGDGSGHAEATSPAGTTAFDFDHVHAGRDLNLNAILMAGATATGTRPGASDQQTAARVLMELENRRVLFDPFDVEQPEACVPSVRELRRFLQEVLTQLDRQSLLAAQLRDMVGVCRHFLTRTEQLALVAAASWRGRREIGRLVFEQALAEMRGQFGVLIGQLAATHGLVVSGPLAAIVPEAES